MNRPSLARIDARFTRRPAGVSNPTLWLLLADLVALGGAVAAHTTGVISRPLATLVWTMGVYCLYTVTHEAVHGNAHSSRRLNDLMGRTAAALQGMTFPIFRIVHLQHHAHTNDPVRDPDHVVGRQPRWLLPLWTIVRLANDNVFMARRRLWTGQRRALVEHLSTVMLQGAVIIVAWQAGHFADLVWLWLLPAAVSGAALELTVAWLVHYPHVSQEPLEHTRMYRGFHWQILTLNQNYHLVHHLWTRVPWFRYGQLAHLAEEAVAKSGRMAPSTPGA